MAANGDFKLCRDYMTIRCKEAKCRFAHDPTYCKLQWMGHCPYGDRCRNKHVFPAANRKDRKKAVAYAAAKEEAKCQALIDLENKGLLPPGTASAALQASVRYRPIEPVSDDSSETNTNDIGPLASSSAARRGRSAGSRSSKSRSRSRPTAGLSSAAIAEVAASATATAALFGPNTAEGRRARSAIAVIRSLPHVGRVLERYREASVTRQPVQERSSSRPASRAPSARSRESRAPTSVAGAAVRASALGHQHREPPMVVNTSAAQQSHISIAMDTNPMECSVPLTNRVLSVHPCIFLKPGDESIYDRLSTEINAVIAAQAQAKEDGTAPPQWRKQCPTFRAVVDRVKTYFGVREVKSTRLNLFTDESESREFQSDRLKTDKGQNANFMINISFGGPREYALMDPSTGKIVSVPLTNGVVYGFGKDLMEDWHHGVLEVPPEKRVAGRGRVSMLLWARLDAVAKGGASRSVELQA